MAARSAPQGRALRAGARATSDDLTVVYGPGLAATPDISVFCAGGLNSPLTRRRKKDPARDL